MTITNKENFKFFTMVEKMEVILGSATNPMELIRLINKKEFLKLREKIINFFEVDIDKPFSGKFGEEVEFGDVSDAVRETTFSLYPADADVDLYRYIKQDERKVWCEKIVERMDAAAIYY